MTDNQKYRRRGDYDTSPLIRVLIVLVSFRRNRTCARLWNVIETRILLENVQVWFPFLIKIELKPIVKQWTGTKTETWVKEWRISREGEDRRTVRRPGTEDVWTEEGHKYTGSLRGLRPRPCCQIVNVDLWSTRRDRVCIHGPRGDPRPPCDLICLFWGQEYFGCKIVPLTPSTMKDFYRRR